MNDCKESAGILTGDGLTNTETRISDDSTTTTTLPINSRDFYPFATVLRLRVLQIVCGISGLVMGAVAVIEEKGINNIGIAIPAGCMTVLAAGAGIHTSRGFGGYKPSSDRTTSLRFLRTTVAVAVPLIVLWSVACSLHLLLTVQVLRTFVSKSSNNVLILAVIELLLTTVTLTALCIIVSINFRFDPD